MVVCFSPKDLGLSTKKLWTISNSSNWIVMGKSMMNFQTIDLALYAVCVIAKVE